MISAFEICKSFGTQKVLDKVSFEVRSGEVLGLLGPNGAGKSTLIKILNGYWAADEGEVLICDKKMLVNSPEIQHLIGYLPERNPLNPEMYVMEYLHYVAGIYGVDKPVIASIVNSVGLASEQHKKIGQLSKGYRQRVGLAQALIPDPEVLILDEPTTGLDPNQIIEVRELIREIAKNKTVLLSTHIMQEVKSVCDRVLIINKGKVVADDSVENILTLSAATQQIELELLQDVEASDLQDATLPVTKVSVTGERQFLLDVDTATDVRQLIAEYVAAKGWTVLMMKRRESDLEDVFSKLTH